MKPKRFCLAVALLAVWTLAAAAAGAQPGATTAFVHVDLVPMTSETIVPDQVVLVSGSRIIAVGSPAQVPVPRDATVIDGSGAYLAPGLADMHMHTHENWLSGFWPVTPLDLYVASGVTTIRCFGPEGRSPQSVLYFREKIRKGDFRGPTIYSCGKQLRGYLTDPEGEVRRQKAAGFDFIKLYSYLSKAEFHRAVATARQMGIYTAGHIPFQVGLDGVLAEGMDEIAHIEELFWEFVEFDRSRHFDNEQEWLTYIIRTTFRQFEPGLHARDRELEKWLPHPVAVIADKVKRGNKPVCTTLFLDDIIVAKLVEPEKFLRKPENRYLPQSYVRRFERGREKHQIQFRGGEAFAPFKRSADQLLLHYLKKAGVELVLGTDAGTGGMGLVPGHSVHQELRLLTRNGFSPYEALRTATVNAADAVERMTGSGPFGTIEVGKRADFILAAGNPLEAVENLAAPRGVMAAGRWYDQAALDEMRRPKIPVTGAVHHVCEPDGSHQTYVDILIGKTFSGRLPNDIDTVTVTGPKGIWTLAKDDFTYIPRLRDFWVKVPGIPDTGIYTFEVTSGDDTGLAADFQYVSQTIPIPDSTKLSPANDATLSAATPTFKWPASATEAPVYYRFEVNRPHGGRIYATGYEKAMLAHTVPEGVLQSGQSYRWRVRVADGRHWTKVQNRSNSRWRRFRVE